LVFSPFAGIGSEGVVALERAAVLRLRAEGEYHATACRNLAAAARRRESKTIQPDLFAGLDGSAA
jgi:hypothetical protein